MVIKKKITILVPSELLYVFDPDYEPVFMLAREKGMMVARPVVEDSTSNKTCAKNGCVGCRCYDDAFDVCQQ